MEKKWPLFILFPLLLILTASLLIYLWKGPKKIKDEYIGTQYQFQDIQFSTISKDLILDEEMQKTFENEGYYNIAYYSNTNDERIIVFKAEDETFESINKEWNQLQNPLKIIYMENFLKKNLSQDSQYFQENNEDVLKYRIQTFYKDNVKIIYNYELTKSNLEIRHLDILLNNSAYTIIVKTNNEEQDVQEIIKSINQIN
jgi:hypothetical protein